VTIARAHKVFAVAFEDRLVQALNQKGTSIVQAVDRKTTTHPLWDAGLNGEGQIIQVVDTGVDLHSCFFEDESSTPTPPFNHDPRCVLAQSMPPTR
jgi:hypothetical protein